ncbi:11423_t:CDS:2, partial [Racocetra persica]
TPDGENENQKYVISGIVKDLTNRTETDHESRMMGHLREVGYFLDSRKPTNDEMRIVKYNNALYIDPSKSETVVTIIDENPKATIQKLVKVQEGNNATDIQEKHQRKNNTCFVKRSETTKALGAIARSIEDFPQ